MSENEKSGSTRRCSMCGKTEQEAGALVHMPPNLDICPSCLEDEVGKMGEMLEQLGFSMPDADTGASAQKDKNTVSTTLDKKESARGGGEKSAGGASGDGADDAGDDDGKEDDGKPRGGWLGFGLPGFFTGSGGGGPFAIGGGGAQKRKERDPDEPLMAPVPLPHELKAQIDDYVVGQELAKRIVAVSAYNHYKRAQASEKDGIEIDKSNILMLGPTGTGKTHLIRTLAKLLDVPLAIADATTLTQAGYVGDDIESIITKLIQAADGDVEKAELGIVYIDEIDKIAKKSNSGDGMGGGSHDIGGEAVQQGLLKLLEGTQIEVPLSGGMKTPFSRSAMVDTTNILFICGGAFPGLEKIITKRLNKSAGIGFGADLKANFDEKRDIFEQVRTEDLKDYGLIPEFIGRLPVSCPMEALDEDMLYDILTKPHDALVKQYQALLGYDEVELEFTDDALRVIARKALAEDTGARGLRAIIEKFMLNIMYEVPKDRNIGAVAITGDYIEGHGAPIIRLRGDVALPAGGAAQAQEGATQAQEDAALEQGGAAQEPASEEGAPAVVVEG